MTRISFGLGPTEMIHIDSLSANYLRYKHVWVSLAPSRTISHPYILSHTSIERSHCYTMLTPANPNANPSEWDNIYIIIHNYT